MAKAEEDRFYSERLLTLNPRSTDEYVKGIYDEWADTYDKAVKTKFSHANYKQSHKPSTAEAGYIAYKTCPPIFDQFVRENFSSNPSKLRILDAGAGTGIVGKVLQNLGYTNVDALDISQKMLDEAKKLNVYKEFICAPLSAEPIAEIATNQYDGLICIGTLTIGHVKPVALDEILRIVKPGGIIGFTLRRDAYEESGPEKCGYREKMSEMETSKKWKLLRCELIDYHLNVDELRAKCYSLMYQVL